MSINQLITLPQRPGIYLMLDSLDNIIYVGKAKNLKNRVSQYFQNPKNRDPKVAEMIAHIHNFQYKVTDTELDALIEECRLIKELKPKYNRQMKNSQKYTYLKIPAEEFPRLCIVQQKAEDDAQYFGPFTSPHQVEKALDYLKEFYPIRKCAGPGLVKRVNGCLFLQLGKCLGACTGQVSKEDYWVHILKIQSLIQGEDSKDVVELSNLLQSAVENLNFEKASSYREYLLGLQHVIGKQSLIRASSKNEIILAVEHLDSEFTKLFLIQGNRLLYGKVLNRFAIVRNELSEHLLAVIKNKTAQTTQTQFSRLDIDEAQIIYSYLKNNHDKIFSYRIPMTRLRSKAALDAILSEVIDLLSSRNSLDPGGG